MRNPGEIRDELRVRYKEAVDSLRSDVANPAEWDKNDPANWNAMDEMLDWIEEYVKSLEGVDRWNPADYRRSRPS